MSALPTSEDRIRAAWKLAELGFGVFSVWSANEHGVCRCPKGAACSSPGKHPMTRQGFHDATSDPARIETLLSAGSNPNYGLVPPEGVFILDVDGAGIDQLAALEERYGRLPDTLTVKTANGEHIYLRWPEAFGPMPSGQLHGFVTRRHDDGYVLGPRSIHPSGVAYERSSATTEIADLPAAWHTTDPQPHSAFFTVTAGNDPALIASGHRHEFLRDQARFMAGTVRDPDALFAALWAINLKLSEPKTEDDVRRAIGDVLEKFGPDPVEPQIEATDAIVSIVDYRASMPTIIPWIVQGLVYAGGVSLIAGPPKAGKSTLAAQIMRCRETGKKLFGALDVRTGPTLLVTEEGGIAVVFKTAGLTSLDVLDRRAAVLRHMTFAQVLDLVAKWAGAHPDGLAFIDTLAVWAGIENENDASETTRALDAINAVAQSTGLGIALVHHARKSGGESGEAIRGSGAILATVDIGAELSRVDLTSDDRWLDVMGRVLMPERYRLGFDRPTMSYGLADSASDLVDIPSDGPGLTREDLASVWQASPKRRAQDLVGKGLLRCEKVKDGRVWAWRYWSVARATTVDALVVVQRPASEPPDQPLLDAPLPAKAGGGRLRSARLPDNVSSVVQRGQRGDEDPDRSLNLSVPFPEVLPTEHVACSDYSAHQIHHVRDGAGWRCLACNPKEES